MKKLALFLIFVILIFVGSCEYLLACHEESMGGELGIGPTLKGHNPSTRVSGLLIFTEAITATTSTTTSCDAYVGYLEKNYDQIEENIAQGEGIFLDAITSFYGCVEESKERFKQLFRENYILLFIDREKNGRALGRRFENVLKSNGNFKKECSILG
tara:strand:+ start:1180 stop:1650 length:471 start_codon:yes stop_codon:yes gene_type:complete